MFYSHGRGFTTGSGGAGYHDGGNLGRTWADRPPYVDVLLESSRVGGVAPGFSIVAFGTVKP